MDESVDNNRDLESETSKHCASGGKKFTQTLITQKLLNSKFWKILTVKLDGFTLDSFDDNAGRSLLNPEGVV